MKLTSIQLQGFKSIDNEGQTIPFFPVTVFLGANGAGKSNLVSAFRLLESLVNVHLQTHVAKEGGVETLLYFGPKKTDRLQIETSFVDEREVKYGHELLLGLANTGGLFIAYETQKLRDHQVSSITNAISLGKVESELPQQSKTGRHKDLSGLLLSALRGCKVYQFHDTTPTAKIRRQGYTDDAYVLQSDGGNLAAFLRAMKKKEKTRPHYDRIVRHIRQVVPQFGDFDLNTLPDNDTQVRLNWREKDSDHLFGPHQLSDGTLRFMALTTLFLQPSASRPGVIVVDEPELGLHPAALGALADMAKSISHESQVVFATQSPALVDHFDTDQIVVVERDPAKPRSVFKQLDAAALKDWLKRYSLSELWEKNVIGGRP